MMIIIWQKLQARISYLVSLSLCSMWCAIWWYDDYHMIICWGYDDQNMIIWWSLYEDMMGMTCWPSPKLVTIKISHCYEVYRKGCNSYKLFHVTILLQHLFVVTILLQQINVVTILLHRIACNCYNLFDKPCNNGIFWLLQALEMARQNVYKNYVPGKKEEKKLTNVSFR